MSCQPQAYDVSCWSKCYNLEVMTQNTGILCWVNVASVAYLFIRLFLFKFVEVFILGWCCVLRMQHLIQPLRHMFHYWSNGRIRAVTVKTTKGHRVEPEIAPENSIVRNSLFHRGVTTLWP